MSIGINFKLPRGANKDQGGQMPPAPLNETLIILIIRIPASITYTNTLFEGESIVNPTIFHGLTAVTRSFVNSSFEKVTFSFALYSWYILLLMGSPSALSESSLIPASRSLCIQDFKATKLTNLCLLTSCLERHTRLQRHKTHEPVDSDVQFRAPLPAQRLSSFVQYSNTSIPNNLFPSGIFMT